MTMGHFSVALIPYSKVKDAPLWLLLLLAQSLDFVWLTLAMLELEVPSPASFLDVTMVELKTEMPYSHTGAGTLVIAAVAAGIVFGVWRSAALAGWAGALVVIHWLCDLLSGWQHEIFTVGTPKVGLGLYVNSPYLAFIIEAAFAGAIVFWYVRSEAAQGRPLVRKKQVALYALFAGGSMFFVANSYYSMRQLLGL